MAVETVTGAPTELAGVYVNWLKVSNEALDPAGIRTALYLFPDETYLYVQRSSILPMTIFDKGAWAIVSAALELKSSREVTWNPDLERRFLFIRRSSQPNEILLIGTEMAIKRFEKLAGNDPDTALLTIAKRRRKTITPDSAVQLRGYLMRNGWHPARLGQLPSTQF